MKIGVRGLVRGGEGKLAGRLAGKGETVEISWQFAGKWCPESHRQGESVGVWQSKDTGTRWMLQQKKGTRDSQDIKSE